MSIRRPRASASLLFDDGRLGRSQPGDRHTVRRTTDVIEPDLVAEHHAGRVAAVLAADPDLELFAGPAAAGNSQLHQSSDAVLIDRLEGIAADDVVLAIITDERTVVVAAHS